MMKCLAQEHNAAEFVIIHLICHCALMLYWWVYIICCALSFVNAWEISTVLSSLCFMKESSIAGQLFPWCHSSLVGRENSVKCWEVCLLDDTRVQYTNNLWQYLSSCSAMARTLSPALCLLVGLICLPYTECWEAPWFCHGYECPMYTLVNEYQVGLRLLFFFSLEYFLFGLLYVKMLYHCVNKTKRDLRSAATTWAIGLPLILRVPAKVI